MQGCINTVVRLKSLRARPKGLRALNDEISKRYKDESQQVLVVDLKKKGHGRIIAAATLGLPLGLGKFGHVLEVDPQKEVSSC